MCALEHVPLVSLSLNLANEHVFAVQGDFMHGRPIMFYVANRKSNDGEYLAYRVSGGLEQVAVVRFMSNPTFSYSPIINVDKFPSSLTKMPKSRPSSRYKGIRLKDLTSLVKVCAYKTVYDESPLPLLLFERDKSREIIMGAATSFGESEDFYCFYYIHLESLPSDRFVRYFSQRSDPPSFSNKLDEHGCIYLKVIKLASSHPLVDIYES